MEYNYDDSYGLSLNALETTSKMLLIASETSFLATLVIRLKSLV
jgi:hypothetical protein